LVRFRLDALSADCQRMRETLDHAIASLKAGSASPLSPARLAAESPVSRATAQQTTASPAKTVRINPKAVGLSAPDTSLAVEGLLSGEMHHASRAAAAGELTDDPQRLVRGHTGPTERHSAPTKWTPKPNAKQSKSAKGTKTAGSAPFKWS
jgi:hypothetical protein